MADMQTTYPGGGVSTQTQGGGLQGMPGGGNTDMAEMMAFFRQMAQRALNARNAQPSVVLKHDVDPRANMARDAAMTGGQSFVKNMPTQPGIQGGYVRTHAGDPGAVMGGWVPGGSTQPNGGGSVTGLDHDTSQKDFLDFERYKLGVQQRGGRTDGNYFTPKAAPQGGGEY